MKKDFTYRAFVFDDDGHIRNFLQDVLHGRGYEVITFSNPSMCPKYKMTSCPCPSLQSCADVIISDMNMPVSSGAEYIGNLQKKGCRCENIALISGSWNKEDFAKAKAMGCKILYKPFQLAEFVEWLDAVENNIHPKRVLSDWWKED